MYKHIVFLLSINILIISNASPSLAQNEAATESGGESSVPLGTLLENSPPENFPDPDSPNNPIERGNDFVIPESIKGFDEQKVLQDPLCDPTHRPTIQTITPDEAKPGDTIRVTGNYFGAKSSCLYSVTFGEYQGEDLILLEENVFEVRVPKELKAGLVFLNIVTNGGSARHALLIKG